MVRIGLVGIGFMGMIHFLAARKLKGAQITALCSRDPRKLAGDWTTIQGNFGPRGEQMDLSTFTRYSDFSQMLADPAIDMVDLCVPNDDHARMAIQALEAGKHVLVEKPIALQSSDANAMVDAARRAGRKLMVAQVLPFFPEFTYAWESVKSGRHGALRAAHFTRVISKPDWSSGIADVQRSGGPAIDLHIHDTHYIVVLWGAPQAVYSRGVIDQGVVTHLVTQYLYDDPNAPVISAVSGALSQAGRPFLHAFDIACETATLSYEFATLGDQPCLAMPLSIIKPDGSVERPDLGSGDPVDAFTRELQTAIESVATGQDSALLSGELARQALQLCHAEIESVRTGEVIQLK